MGTFLRVYSESPVDKSVVETIGAQVTILTPVLDQAKVSSGRVSYV